MNSKWSDYDNEEFSKLIVNGMNYKVWFMADALKVCQKKTVTSNFLIIPTKVDKSIH